MKIATLLKSSTALSMVALLALSACGGGGGDGPETGGMLPGDGDGMMPDDGDGDGMMPDDGDGDGMMPDDGDGDGMMPDDGDGDGMMPDDGDGDGMMPDDGDGDGMTQDGSVALANVVDLVANAYRTNSDGYRISGLWQHLKYSGLPHASITRTYDSGSYASVILHHDERAQLQHYVSLSPFDPLPEANYYADTGRLISTRVAPEELEGVSRLPPIPLEVPELEPEWEVTQLINDYDNAGTLNIYVATDVQRSDGAMHIFGTGTIDHDNIQISGAPNIPNDRDNVQLWIHDGDTIGEALNGEAGSFSCANASGCWFETNRRREGYFAVSAGITFTSDGGVVRDVSPANSARTVPNADYLAFGQWLYVPEDVTDSDDYEFGVFASGGDPFVVANLRALTGSASYVGDAIGKYYVNGLSSNPTVGSFTADVTLTADFGDSNANGFIWGEVTGFDFTGGGDSSLPTTIYLTSYADDSLAGAFGAQAGTDNIFDTPHNNRAALDGGLAGGATTAHVDGEDWQGDWHGVFYGNDPDDPSAHPTGVAGTFGNHVLNVNEQSESGLTGAFGAQNTNQ